MAKSGVEQYTVRHPDFIPEEDEHLYPAMGGVYHDYIPEGKTSAEVYGVDVDDTKSGIPEDKEAKAKGKKNA